MTKKTAETKNRRKGLLIVMSGPAGSGKGTIVNALLTEYSDFMLSVSATTRAPGPSERNGVEYHFITRTEFEKMISEGKLLEYNEYLGNYYGTPKKPVLDAMKKGKSVLLEIDINGAAQIKKEFPEAVLVMIVPPDAVEQEKRLRFRGRDSEESIIKRLKRAEEEIAAIDRYDYVIVNRDGQVEKAAAEMCAIVSAEQCRSINNLAIKDTYFTK